MVCRIDDLRCKEVIDVKSGKKLGYPEDIEFETATAKICKLIIPGRPRFFGLFGRGEDILISWCDIEVIGVDTILISLPC